MHRNLISKETKVVLNIYKTLIRRHVDYCTQDWPTELRQMECNIEFGGHTKKSEKNNKKGKRLHLQ